MTDAVTVSVAVVGAGHMGSAMVVRLREQGVPTFVYNRTPSKANALATAGARVCGSAREAAESAQIVIVSLADDDAVRHTYAGDHGIAAGLSAGKLVLETSTIDPQTVREVEPLITSRGARLLDTPVSGSVQAVQQGSLTVMAGGDPDDVDRASPVLTHLADRIYHVGALGAGATMKLAVNAIVHGLNQSLAESLVLAERAGVQREVAYEVFANSAIAAPFVQYKRAAYEHPEQAAVAFTLDLVGKDLDLIARLATRVGARMDQVAANRTVVRDALAGGFADGDISALAVYLRTSAPQD